MANLITPIVMFGDHAALQAELRRMRQVHGTRLQVFDQRSKLLTGWTAADHLAWVARHSRPRAAVNVPFVDAAGHDPALRDWLSALDPEAKPLDRVLTRAVAALGRRGRVTVLCEPGTELVDGDAAAWGAGLRLLAPWFAHFFIFDLQSRAPLYRYLNDPEI
jgi:hypothetical protein